MRSTILFFALSVLLFSATGAFAQTLYLPQVADGSFGSVKYRTTFVIFNNSEAPASSLLVLTDDSGNPMTVTLGGFGTASQFSIDLAPGSTGFLQTDGSGTGNVGAATLYSTTPVGLSAYYTVYDGNGYFLTQSGVEPSVPMTSFMFPVDTIGPYITGLALFNPGADASVNLKLLNPNGTQAATAQKSLTAGGHASFFVSDLFPTIANFRGALLVESTSAVSAIALRQYWDTVTLCNTSLPVTALSSTALSLNLPQVANGSIGAVNYKTSFHVFNVSQTPAHVTLALTKDDGSPFSITIPGSGPGTGTSSNFNFTLPVGGSIFLESDGKGSGSAGAATVTSDTPIGAASVFTVLDSQNRFQTEAGVGDSPVFSSITVPIDLDSSTNTGIALFNPGTGSITLSISILDGNGVLINSTGMSLNSKNHTASFVNQMFPGLANMRGSLAITSSGMMSSTILRQFGPASSLNLTTFVPYPGTAAGRVSNPALLSKEVTGINAVAGDPDVSFSQVLSPGSTLSGTLSGAGPGIQVIATSSGGNVYTAPVTQLTGHFDMVLPPGSYRVSVVYHPNGSPNASGLLLTYVDPNLVNVTSGGTIHNMSLPEPALMDVSGTVTDSSGLSLAGAGSQVVFTSSDYMKQGWFALDANGAFSGLLPSADYSAAASLAPAPFNSIQSTEQLNFLNIGSLTVGTGAVTANYNLPPIAILSGSVVNGSPGALPSDSFVHATDSAAPVIPPNACCTVPATSLSTVDPSGRYQMVLARNRSYGIGITVPLNMGAGLAAAVNYPTNPTIVNLNGDTVFSINIPPQPGRAVIFGNVNDGLGHALSNVTVTAYSQTLTGTTNMDYTVSGKTDIYGNYSVLVLSGKYRLSFVPPAP